MSLTNKSRKMILKEISNKLKGPHSVSSITDIYQSTYPHLDIFGQNLENALADSMGRILEGLETSPGTVQEKKKLLDSIEPYALYIPAFHRITYLWWKKHTWSERLDILIRKVYYLYDNEDFVTFVYSDLRNYLIAHRGQMTISEKTKIWRILNEYSFEDLRPLAGYTRAMKRRS